MRVIKSTVDTRITDQNQSCLTHNAARAIVLKGEQILLVFTQRFEDYSLPGGGIDPQETQIDGLIRELKEETGAQNIRDIKEYGRYDEIRPWNKQGYPLIKMISFCYTCSIDEQLLAPTLEDYEISNGMRPCWINIHTAIAHNQKIIEHSNKQGLSIIRETYLLELIARELCA